MSTRKFVHDGLRERLEARAGVLATPTAFASDGLASERLGSLYLSEWSPEFWSIISGIVRSDLGITHEFPVARFVDFETFMRNRLVQGALRYGLLNAPGKRKYDRSGSIRRRVSLFVRTGNAEHLVDIANLCLCQYVEGPRTWWIVPDATAALGYYIRADHPKFHFDSHDGDESGEHAKPL